METIIRVHKDLDADPFARIDKVPINDPDMSFKALGILTYLLSKPNGWDTRISQLIKAKIDKEKSVRSGISELVDLKHILRFKLINDRGQVVKWTYQVYERPHQEDPPDGYITVKINDPLSQNGKMVIYPLSGYPQVDNPQVDNPQVDKDPPINNIFKKLKNLNTKEDINNNNRGARKVGADVVVEVPIEIKKQYLKLIKTINTMGWVGSLEEFKTMFIADPDYVTTWVNYLDQADTSKVKNVAALLRSSLRSGKRPGIINPKEKEKNIERAKLAALGLNQEEIESMI